MVLFQFLCRCVDLFISMFIFLLHTAFVPLLIIVFSNIDK